MRTITYETHVGQQIQQVCAEAVALAKRENCIVQFEFNDQTLAVKPDSDPAALVKAFTDECDRRHAEWVASPEYAKQQEEARRAQERRDAALLEALARSPAKMSLADEAKWQTFCVKNSDPYGNAVVTYAERWARLMEGQIAKGKRLEDMADEMSHLADNEGITGFMYGCAVSVLASVWTHGEQLRRWHNLKTQLRDEGEKANASGGVLNPAILTINQ